jgi:hypothetical protein
MSDNKRSSILMKGNIQCLFPRSVGKVLPEYVFCVYYSIRDNHSYGHGRFTQGLAMEHLAHVVFGMKPLSGAATNMRDICDNFYADCPGSPCKLP